MSVAGIISPSPVFTGLDASGNPLSGGLVYFYATGGTTPQIVYTDSALTTPWSQPVVLDSAGRATIYYDASLSYKAILKSAAGVTQYTVDPVYVPSSYLPVVLSKVFANSPYTVTAADGFDVLIECDCTAGAITVSPYTAIGNAGKRITVKKTDASANAVTIDPNGSQTIDGSATIAVSTQYALITIESNGANWDKLSVSADQSVNVGGSPSFASPTVTTALNLTGGQIAFPATQVPSSGANTLDDYEEGSFTPSFGGSGGQSSQVYAAQVGRYVKVGKLVTCWGRVQLSTLGTITTNVQIQGLPFAADATSGYRFAAAIGEWESFTTSYISIAADGVASATAMTLYVRATAGSGNLPIAQGDLTANTALTFTVSYMAGA